MKHPVPPVFRFLWIGNAGPAVKCFESVHAFSGYVRHVRDVCGWDSVEFRTPILAVGALVLGYSRRLDSVAQSCGVAQ